MQLIFPRVLIWNILYGAASWVYSCTSELSHYCIQYFHKVEILENKHFSTVEAQAIEHSVQCWTLPATRFPSLVLTQPFKAPWPTVPITMVCSWKQPMKLFRKERTNAFLFRTYKSGKTIKFQPERPVYYPLLQLGEATLRACMHKGTPCDPLPRMHAMSIPSAHNLLSFFHSYSFINAV